MAKLTWVTNTTTWYEYELTPKELEEYLADEDKFLSENDIFADGEIVREKVIEDDVIQLIDNDESDEDDE
jgi:hypothetical protein